MPNQPANNKRQFGVSLTIEDKDFLDEEAARLGVTRTEVIRMLIAQARKKKNKAEQ